MKAIKFSGPQDEVNLDFRALPTPMVNWKGTAKELHDIIMEAWVESEPSALALPEAQPTPPLTPMEGFDIDGDELVAMRGSQPTPPDESLYSNGMKFLRASLEECAKGKTVTFTADHLETLVAVFEGWAQPTPGWISLFRELRNAAIHGKVTSSLLDRCDEVLFPKVPSPPEPTPTKKENQD